jgi:hypothetical protein
MKTLKEFLSESDGEERHSRTVVVVFSNYPSSKKAQLLFESCLQELEEGKTKEWSSGYTYRLDRRPQNQGGDQLHIHGPKGKAWAYRYNGAKSEPHKYSLQTTNIVKDIVADVFGISRSLIEEAIIRDATKDVIRIEMFFA